MSFEHGLDVHPSGYCYRLSGFDCRFFLRGWICLCLGGLIGLGDPFGFIGLGFVLVRGNACGWGVGLVP
uniref:Transmembrane protein n=1 Tax=Picea glauca TaxID=3330 RepID=A0A101LV02_PICGL|nr:hypothetical protein ABT39_MTgene2189 [Picea glauca]QHR88066.1 hypothetical protein Q903MT_gene2078 [Picea sitchensis]